MPDVRGRVGRPLCVNFVRDGAISHVSYIPGSAYSLLSRSRVGLSFRLARCKPHVVVGARCPIAIRCVAVVRRFWSLGDERLVAGSSRVAPSIAVSCRTHARAAEGVRTRLPYRPAFFALTYTRMPWWFPLRTTMRVPVIILVEGLYEYHPLAGFDMNIKRGLRSRREWSAPP